MAARLRKSDSPQRIFDAVREVVTATGVLAGNTKRALDSVVLEDAMATQDPVTQLIAAVRRVRRDVPGAASRISSAEQCSRNALTREASTRPVGPAPSM